MKFPVMDWARSQEDILRSREDAFAGMRYEVLRMVDATAVYLRQGMPRAEAAAVVAATVHGETEYPYGACVMVGTMAVMLAAEAP